VDSRENHGGGDVLRMLDARAKVTHPPGGVRVEKAGVAGTGPTLTDAEADWCRKFAEMIARPGGHRP
jgi:hypothetical protein